MNTTEAQTLADLIAKIETLAESYVDCAAQARKDAADSVTLPGRAASIAAASAYSSVACELRNLIK